MSRADSHRSDPGFWLCGLLMLLCPPLFLVAAVFTLIEDWQDRRDRAKLFAECAGKHEFMRDPYWDIYPDLRKHEVYCRHCYTPASSEEITLFTESNRGIRGSMAW